MSATNNKSSNGFRATMPSVRKPHTPLHGITILAGNNDAPKANIRENNVSTAGELLIPRTEAVNLSGGVDCVRTSLISPSSSSDQMLVGAEDKMDQRKLAALTQGNDRDVGIDDDEEITTTMDSGIAAISCYSSAPLLQAGLWEFLRKCQGGNSCKLLSFEAHNKRFSKCKSSRLTPSSTQF